MRSTIEKEFQRRTAGKARAVLLALLAIAATLGGPGRLAAQTAAEPAPSGAAPAAAPHPKKSHNPVGTPLDTLMQTRLYADVPEAKDFVRQARRPVDSLAFQPTQGTDPERPKPRSKPELEALRSELESAAQHNAARAGLRPVAAAAKPPAAKTPKAVN